MPVPAPPRADRTRASAPPDTVIAHKDDRTRASAPQASPSNIPVPAPPRDDRTRASAPPEAVIVHKKEAQAWQEPQPVPQSGGDIEFIRKTVRQEAGKSATQTANLAVNLPTMEVNPGASPGELRGLERQVSAIADQVYTALERRLRSEQMRKGLF